MRLPTSAQVLLEMTLGKMIALQLPLVDEVLLLQLALWAEAVGNAASTKTAIAARGRIFLLEISGGKFPPQIPPPRPQNKSGRASKRRRMTDWQRNFIGEKHFECYSLN